jgi:Zn-dependent protease with chaperone function
MSEPMMRKTVLTGLPSDAFVHPFDVSARKKLENTPGVSKLAEWINSVYEKIKILQLQGNAIRVSNKQYPDLYKRYLNLSERMDLNQLPELFIERGNGVFGASAVGVNRYVISVTDDIVAGMTSEELDVILARELGHVKCGYMKWNTAAAALKEVGETIGEAVPFGIGTAVIIGAELAILHWARMAAFSADRAALLATQDSVNALSAIGKLAGPDLSEDCLISTDALIEQADGWHEAVAKGAFAKLINLHMILTETHPLPVVRVKELSEWAGSDHYKNILEGNYENPDATKTPEIEKVQGRVFRCSKCSSHNLTEAKFCGSCGNSMKDCNHSCGLCNTIIEIEWKICPGCGEQLLSIL